MHGNAVVDEIPIVLTARKSLGEAKTAELLDALKNTAAQFGENIRTGSGSKREVIAEEHESIAASIDQKNGCGG